MQIVVDEIPLLIIRKVTLGKILERRHPRTRLIIRKFVQFLNPPLLFIVAHLQDLVVLNTYDDILFSLELSHFGDYVGLMLDGLDELFLCHIVTV